MGMDKEILKYNGINDLLTKCTYISYMQSRFVQSLIDYLNEDNIPYTPVGDNIFVDIKNLSKTEVRKIKEMNQDRDNLFKEQIKQWNNEKT